MEPTDTVFLIWGEYKVQTKLVVVIHLKSWKIIADYNILLKFTPETVTESVSSHFRKLLENEVFFGVAKK